MKVPTTYSFDQFGSGDLVLKFYGEGGLGLSWTFSSIIEEVIKPSRNFIIDLEYQEWFCLSCPEHVHRVSNLDSRFSHLAFGSKFGILNGDS